MSEPKISLITPVLNAGEALEQTLQSVEAQTLHPYEHIIVDGLSTDGSLERLKEYAARVPYTVRILSCPPKGVYNALNQGFNEADGDVLGLLHGGDRFASAGVLSEYASAFCDHPEVPLVYADIRYFREDGKSGRYYSGAPFRPSLLKWGYMFPHPSMYIRRRLWDEYGPYREDYTIGADFEWIVRILLAGGETARYLPLLSVEMQPGGLSSRWRHRLCTTPREKLRALRTNGFPTCPLRLLARYLYALPNPFASRLNNPLRHN